MSRVGLSRAQRQSDCGTGVGRRQGKRGEWQMAGQTSVARLWSSACMWRRWEAYQGCAEAVVADDGSVSACLV
ncbi:hypothetical protein C2E23DRAFT_800374 [Lenzites betulinus]|nr:hypothetical protein C2E23DRAFT_800374 [Lenzites betulinus]